MFEIANNVRMVDQTLEGGRETVNGPDRIKS